MTTKTTGYRNHRMNIVRAVATAGLCLALTACGSGLDALDSTTDTDDDGEVAARTCDSGSDLVFVTGMASDTITTFSLDRNDGTLTQAAVHEYADVETGMDEEASPVGGAPMHMAVNGDGTRLYVANSANKRNWDYWGSGYCSVGVFDINHDTGELTEIEGSPFYAYADPADHDTDDDGVTDYEDECSNTSVIFNHDGSVLMSIGGENSDAMFFHVDSATGALEHYYTDGTNRGHHPALHPTEDIFMWGRETYSLDGESDYAVTATGNSVGPWAFYGAIFGTWGGTSYMLAASGNNYVSVIDLTDMSALAGSSVTIYRYSKDGSGVDGIASNDDDAEDYVGYPRDIAATSDSSKFFLSDMERNLVLTYAVDENDLTSFTPVSEVDSIRQPRSLAMSSDGGHLLVSSFENYTVNTVSVADDGSLEAVDAQEVPGAYRSGIAVVPNQCE